MDNHRPKGLGRISTVVATFKTGPVKLVKAIKGLRSESRKSGKDVSLDASRSAESLSYPSSSTRFAKLSEGELGAASKKEVGELYARVDLSTADSSSAMDSKHRIATSSSLPLQSSGGPSLRTNEEEQVRSPNLVAMESTVPESALSHEQEQSMDPDPITENHSEEVELPSEPARDAKSPKDESTKAAILPILSPDELQIEENRLTTSEELEQTSDELQMAGQPDEVHADPTLSPELEIGAVTTKEAPPISTSISVEDTQAQAAEFAWTCGGDLNLSQVKRVGHGSHSEVHMMRNCLTGQVFARKLTKCFAAVTVDMIENEHRVVKKLSPYSCKHVVAVLDLGTFLDSSHYFIDMELCDIHLGQYIYENRSSQFEITRIWSIMGEISDGLAFIHSHKEVHRDLKPPNILYSPQTECWKIADFGLSKTFSTNAMSTQFSMGTPGYRAPELLTEHPTFSDRADIWALGCILYELAVKQKAFTDDFAVLDYTTTRSAKSIPLAESTSPLFGRILTNLIHEMLHHESLHRPSAKQLLELFNLQIDPDPDMLSLERAHSWFAKLCQISTDIDVESLTVSIAPAPQPINFMVNLERYPHFVGRDKLLSDLHTRLSDTSAQKYNHRVAIYGCGGIGKTQIAIEYTYRYAKFYENVFWISAKDQSALLTGFQDIANITGCAQPGLKLEEQAKVVLVWLQQHGGWLLVLDNLDDISIAKGYLPEMSKGGHTLITTRNPFSKDIPADGFEIPLFGSEEAIELLGIRSEITASNFEAQVASEIVFELDHLPLAIEQPAAFIRKAVKSLSEFLFIYRKSRKVFLQRTPTGNDTYSNSLAATFLLSFNKLKEMENGLRATKLLQLLSFLSPDGILIEVLRSGSEQPVHPFGELISDDLMFYETVETLAQFSLVRRSGGGMLMVHRLIQAVVKDGLTKSEICAWRGKIVDMCDIAFPRQVIIDQDFSNEVRPLCRLVSTQLLSPLLDAAEICNEKAASTLRRVGWFLQEDGIYDDSERLVEQSVIIYKRLFGEECENSLMGMNRLARPYGEQGRLKDAGSLGRQVLEVSIRVLGEEHPVTLAAKGSLAVIYWSLGEFTEAAALGEAVLEARERIFGEEHPETLNAKTNLGLTYSEMGKLREAMMLEESVLEAEKRTLGDEHPSTLTTKANLAVTYCEMGRLKEGVALEENVLEAREKILGELHPDTLTVKGNLAVTYKEMGRLKEAEALQENVLEAREMILGEAHPSTLLTKANLAAIYFEMGRLKEALALEESVLDATEKILGEEHPDTLTVKGNLAVTYKEMGRLKEALALEERVLDAREKILGEEHPDTLMTKANLAMTYTEMGRLKEAAVLNQKVLEASRRIRGPSHPRTLRDVHNKALIMRSMGDLEAAEELGRSAMESMPGILGNEHGWTLDAQSN